jgi:GNAT superfamily N-acetyltransferase
MIEIFWEIERMDDNQEIGAADGECLLDIDGDIHSDGRSSGKIGATYIFSEEPETRDAFLWLWDLTGSACHVYEDIISKVGRKFREPLPDLLHKNTGILCIHYIALKPEFRKRGLGREVIRDTVRQLADHRVGAVLIEIRPIQHRPNGYDHFFDEIRDLPFNDREVDQDRLMQHFESWGMVPVQETNFMVAAPSTLCTPVNQGWYPGLLED